MATGILIMPPWMRPTNIARVYPLATASRYSQMWVPTWNTPHTSFNLRLRRRTTPSSSRRPADCWTSCEWQESSKGTDVLREAHRLLNQTDLNYLGYVESRDFPEGCADVVVTDGLVGNIVLKLCEGMVTAVFGRIDGRCKIFVIGSRSSGTQSPLSKQL